MIVTCDACQTRFRIPDEKVTDKGVKVRCTKCQNTFRVTREVPAPPAPAPALPPAPPPVPDAGFDPFAAFSPSAEPNLDEATRPFTLSPEMMAQLGFDQPPAGAAPAPPRSPPPLPAAPPRPADPFAFLDEVSPPRPPPAQRAAHDPFAALDLPPAAPPPPARPAHDPFAALDLPPAAPPTPARPAHDPFADLDLAPAAPPPPARPAHDPFALLDTTQPGGPGLADPFASTQPAFPQAPQPALEATPPEGGGPAFGELSSPGFGMPSAFSESTQTGIIPNGEPDRGAFDTSGESFDANASTGTFPRPMDRGMFDMPAPAPRSEGLLGDVPPAGDDPGAGDFGAGGFGPDGLSGGGYGGQDPYGGAGFDPGAGGFGGQGFGEEVTATGVLPVPAPPPPALPAPTPGEPQTGSPRSGPSPAAQAALAPEGGGAIRSFGGALVNIAAAVLLLAGLAAVAAVYLNGGRVELAGLSADHLQHLWSREGDVVTRDVSNGLYDTRGGHAVLFVRGFVENRTGAPGKVKVTAEIYDGDQLLRPASVYAGQSPTPEQLAAISGQPDVEALMAKLNAAAAEVPPGQKVPFLVPFYEYPTDLSGLRMKVTASAPEPVTAKR